mgnify:CR=1 FL=1
MAIALSPWDYWSAQHELLSLNSSLMDLSKIPAQPKPGIVNVLIEIPGGSKNKYEYDKDMQAFALDRVM